MREFTEAKRKFKSSTGRVPVVRSGCVIFHVSAFCLWTLEKTRRIRKRQSFRAFIILSRVLMSKKLSRCDRRRRVCCRKNHFWCDCWRRRKDWRLAASSLNFVSVWKLIFSCKSFCKQLSWHAFYSIRKVEHNYFGARTIPLRILDKIQLTTSCRFLPSSHLKVSAHNT